MKAVQKVKGKCEQNQKDQGKFHVLNPLSAESLRPGQAAGITQKKLHISPWHALPCRIFA
jgi:hypothetical protein